MIALRGLGKWYPTRFGRKWVFRDVTACVPSGANVGVFGLNGSGKSTLLRMLGGSDRPSEGGIHITGSVSWPMGLAGGWQGSMTGRQNARFVARIHGLSADGADRVCDFARDFSELGKDFDLPVKTYSSGMRARLAFAVSMAFEFDYYLIDELTAVGDQRFKDKSAAALRARKARACWIMASHDVRTLAAQMDVGILVHAGTLTIFDDPARALETYQQVVRERRTAD